MDEVMTHKYVDGGTVSLIQCN